MKPPLLLIAMTVATSGLFARIGETAEQCVRRYGEPLAVDREKQVAAFLKAGLEVTAHFHDKKVQVIQFQKAEKNALGISVELSTTELEALMKAQGGERKWNALGSSFTTSDRFATTDGELLAFYDTFKHTLMIVTKEAAARTMEEGRKAEAKNLEEF